ncbi:MAG TPA: hypothetical protein VN721_11905 [Flavipsychrobacter sp.]|nr:hypothetical protein [Flavipsychrobacter sp.]
MINLKIVIDQYKVFSSNIISSRQFNDYIPTSLLIPYRNVIAVEFIMIFIADVSQNLYVIIN